MENNIKVLELKNKKQKKRILNILETTKTKNIYLLEGIISENPNNNNLLFYSENKLISIVHLKLNKYIHIHCFTNNRPVNIELGTKLKSMLPEVRSIFGDKNNVDFFKEIYSNSINKIINYTFMELIKEKFHPVYPSNYTNISKLNFNITPDSYPGILSLQIFYEIEELEIDLSKIKKEILKRIIDLRIKRGEMTVLKIGKKSIGIAAINARYRDICQIGSVYIDRAYRGKGYGTLLLSEHFKRLFKTYKRIVLFVRKDNKIAYNLYKNLGCIATGELEQIILKSESN